MVDFNITDGNDVNSQVAGGAVVAVEAEQTPLVSLKKRREQIVNELYTDIKVPRWEQPEIYVRFKPVSTTKLNSTLTKYANESRKNSNADFSLVANAEMLYDSCVGIYAVFDGDTENKLSLRSNDPHGRWTKFDTDLADALGIEAKRATDSVIGLYLTEGDLIETANKLFRWSNIANNEADETF